MKIRTIPMTLGLLAAVGCSANVKVDPVEVKPIKMTIDINIKVDRQLDNFFDFEEDLERMAPETPAEGRG